jgi:hypothetical protein
MRVRLLPLLALCLLVYSFASLLSSSPPPLRPVARVVLDAHNCYPYYEWWFDRIDRALSAGTPLAIEQDLLWAKNPRTGAMTSLVSHGAPATGSEPGIREYFFERIRPIVPKALRDGDHGDWPLITLNLDLKSEEPEHLEAIWQLLSQYQDWLTTAPRTASIEGMEPMDVRPVLVLTGESEAQEAVFYSRKPGIGRRKKRPASQSLFSMHMLTIFGFVSIRWTAPRKRSSAVTAGSAATISGREKQYASVGRQRPRSGWITLQLINTKI